MNSCKEKHIFQIGGVKKQAAVRQATPMLNESYYDAEGTSNEG